MSVRHVLINISSLWRKCISHLLDVLDFQSNISWLTTRSNSVSELIERYTSCDVLERKRISFWCEYVYILWPYCITRQIIPTGVYRHDNWYVVTIPQVPFRRTLEKTLSKILELVEINNLLKCNKVALRYATWNRSLKNNYQK